MSSLVKFVKLFSLINSSKIAEARIIHEKKNSIDLIWNDKPKSKSEPFFFLENKLNIKFIYTD